MKNQKVSIAVFLVAYALGLQITGVTPILGVLNEKYQSYGMSVVQILQTLPYALLMVGSLLVGWWTAKQSKKRIVTIGLIGVGVCGMLPFFGEGFYLLLGSRFLIGFGFGVIGTMNTAIISELIRPVGRPFYMGLHVVGMGIGAMVGNLGGGMLSGFGFRYFYLVYGAAFVAALGVQWLLPETPPVAGINYSKMKLNKKVYLIAGASFMHTLFITGFSTNIGIYVLEHITQRTEVTGVVTAINAAFALLVGATFAKLSKIFQKYTLTVAIFAAAAGYGAILWLPGITGVYLGSALCGISLSCFMAQSTLLISTAVTVEAVAKAGGIFSIIGGIGGLFAPIILGSAAWKICGANTTTNQFLLSFLGMLILGVVTLVVAVRRPEAGGDRLLNLQRQSRSKRECKLRREG